MERKRLTDTGTTLQSICMVGAAWGIFEATVGYLLHLLPFSIGFLVWYPVAVFFLLAAHRATGRKGAVLATAGLAAAIKLLNLALPGRMDRVINPAVSILLEGAAVACALYVWERVQRAKATGGLLLVSISMNCLWRVLYLGYLAFLVPDWMRNASVLQSGGKLLRFLVVDQLCSSFLVFAGMQLWRWPGRRANASPRTRREISGWARALLCVGLIAVNITLQMVLA